MISSTGQEKKSQESFLIFSVEELPAFFQEAGWGILSLEKTLKDETFYIMTIGDELNIQDRSFQLEAGFIAEQYQKLNGLLTECYGEAQFNKGHVTFQVKWDTKTKIDV